MTKSCIGIDPGAQGALAVIWDNGEVFYCDINGSYLDAIVWLREQSLFGIDGVVIENVNSFGMGRQSAFNFGETRGHLRGACIALEIPIIAEPTPQQWRKAILGGQKKQDKAVLKEQSREKCRELYPASCEWLKRKKDADRAEAVLLAHYGRQLR